MIVWFNTSAPGSTMPEQPLPELLKAIGIGVDVTKEGTHVVAVYKQKDGVTNVFFSEFYPAPSHD
jgi:hypothetical protein